MLKKLLKFAGVGIIATLIDYTIYTFCILVLFNGDTNSAWLGTIISGLVSTFAAFAMHNRITWKERDPGKYGVLKFFVWNGVTVAAIRPVLTFVFGLFTGLYQFAFGISSWLHLPFSYDFITSTGIFGFMTIVTMALNYLVYERFVFGTTPDKPAAKTGKR